ncbi:hypothetical protein HIM_12490 [Hirsutella minnesotensis 3608]|uniref:Pacifastin domain-containing protein n=1 Tax=Hirsutella minnesotensis 3608 TaxID=1043627 RepID=A0A0F7ZHY9_9HYPO|nr:hypothetical protein HIM_12490 [Hirsutella minnesotensis 3608]
MKAYSFILSVAVLGVAHARVHGGYGYRPYHLPASGGNYRGGGYSKLPLPGKGYMSGGYSQQECEEKHGKGGWTCDDGCNTCSCGPTGITSTLIACGQTLPPPPEEGNGSGYGGPPGMPRSGKGYGGYDQRKCQKKHGEGSWTCDDGCNTCTCTPTGIASTRKACVKEPHGGSSQDDGY